MQKPPKRPRDMMQLAKMVGEIATGERSDEPKVKRARPKIEPHVAKKASSKRR